MPNPTNWLIEKVDFLDLAGFEYDTEYSSGDTFFTDNSGYKIQGEYVWWQQLYEGSSTSSDLFGDVSEDDLLDLNFFQYTKVEEDGDYTDVLFLIMPKDGKPEENPFADEAVWDYETFSFTDPDYGDDSAYTDESFEAIASTLYNITTQEPTGTDVYSIEYLVDQSIRCIAQCNPTIVEDPAAVPEVPPSLGLTLLVGLMGAFMFKRGRSRSI